MQLLEGVASEADLGKHFSGGLYSLEIDYLIGHEFAENSEDGLWRRIKLGLYLYPLSFKMQKISKSSVEQVLGVKVKI